MPEIEIRPALTTDLATLAEIDHSCKTDYVWQMDRSFEVGQMAISFREIRLPRSVRIEYPHTREQIVESWKKAAVILMAVLGGKPVGYLSINDISAPRTAWITNLAVEEHHRRQGIASALLLSTQDWARARSFRRILMEMPSKNYSAVHLAIKLGFEFCGYNDQYYANQDIALFFSRAMR
ncbi:GNAT family N-acetyltransferase [bacterium]|jgi:ribosomal protein S18 acetylase RimI-like enzyme|nr:GNAT family N-acetyltransferase [bacterium]